MNYLPRIREKTSIKAQTKKVILLEGITPGAPEVTIYTSKYDAFPLHVHPKHSEKKIKINSEALQKMSIHELYDNYTPSGGYYYECISLTDYINFMAYSVAQVTANSDLQYMIDLLNFENRDFKKRAKKELLAIQKTSKTYNELQEAEHKILTFLYCEYGTI
jgi:hypothetical protein